MTSHWGSTLEKTHFLPNLLSLPRDCVLTAVRLAFPRTMPSPNGFACQLFFLLVQSHMMLSSMNCFISPYGILCSKTTPRLWQYVWNRAATNIFTVYRDFGLSLIFVFASLRPRLRFRHVGSDKELLAPGRSLSAMIESSSTPKSNQATCSSIAVR
jgi:hypothetical protein